MLKLMEATILTATPALSCGRCGSVRGLECGTKKDTRRVRGESDEPGVNSIP